MTNDILTALIVNTAIFTLLFVLMLIVRKFMAKKISAVMQYVLWAVVVIKLIIPFGFESSLSPFSLLSASDNTVPAISQPQDVTDSIVLEDDYRFTASHDGGKSYSQTGTDQINNNIVHASNDIVALETAPVKSVNKLQPLEPTTWALLIWGGGVLIVAIMQCLCVINLKRRVKHAGLPISPRVMQIFESCKKELGIKRRVKVQVQSALKVPFVVSAVSPNLVLPQDIETQSDEQIRNICLHELSHLKHGDLVVITLLNMLCAVYWFNPFVWLCFKLIRKDMETVCDARVLSHVGKAKRQGYIDTVLRFTAHDEQQYLYAAMGMADGRMKMEQRIRGMFKKNKTSIKTRIVAVSIAVLMLTMCVLTACQPTPETEVVIGKDQDKMLEEAQQTQTVNKPVKERLSAPETYSVGVSAADGKLTVAADGAPIILPNVNSIPTVRVKAADFTQEQVDKIISALFDGQTIYETEWGQETKDEILAQIVNCKRMKASEEYSSEGDQAQLDEMIARLEILYEKAPETSEDIITVSDGQLKQLELKDENNEHVAYYTGINVSTNTDDYEKSKQLQVQNNNDMKESTFDVRTDSDGNVTGMSGRIIKRNAMLHYSNHTIGGSINWGWSHVPIPVDESTVIENSNVLDKLQMTPAEAKGQVETLLKKAGIDEMTVYAMYLVDDEMDGSCDGIVSSAENYAYRIYCCRTVNGMPCAFNCRGDSTGGAMVGIEDSIDEAVKEASENGTSPDLSDYKYMGEWYYESLEVMISDKGIISLDWRSPLEINETIVEDTALLPFEEIAERFERQMKIEHEVQANEEYITDMTFTVKHVSLELQRVTEQDSIENGLLVPVWNFYGTSVTTYDYDNQGDGSEAASVSKSGFAQPISLMTINAINGSIINTERGY